MSKSYANIEKDEKGITTLFLRGEWSENIAKTLTNENWERIAILGVEWSSYEPLIPYRDKIRWLSVSLGPNSSDGLDKLSSLEILVMRDYPKPAIDFSSLPNLKSLEVIWDKTRPLSYLANNHLESLIIHSSGAENLIDLSDLKQLKILEIRKGSLKTLEGIKNLISLQDLHLTQTKNLVDISEIKEVKQLQTLITEGLNKVVDIIPVFSLEHLRVLDLDAPNATTENLGWLSSMKNLEELTLTVKANDISWVDIGKHTNLKNIAITAASETNKSDDEIIKEIEGSGRRVITFKRLVSRHPGFIVELG